MSWVERYVVMATEYPIRTNAATAGVLCSIGDVLAQVTATAAPSSRADQRHGLHALPAKPPPAHNMPASRAQVCEWKLSIMSPEKEEFNWRRTLRMACFGTAICGPVLTLWYRTLNNAAESLR
jgi:hypothetical protein